MTVGEGALGGRGGNADELEVSFAGMSTVPTSLSVGGPGIAMVAFVDLFPAFLFIATTGTVSLIEGVGTFLEAGTRPFGPLEIPVLYFPFSRTGKSSGRRTGACIPCAACEAIVLERPLLAAKDLTSCRAWNGEASEKDLRLEFC
jgi:hypothetical protein